jgi:hypothetical protein
MINREKNIYDGLYTNIVPKRYMKSEHANIKRLRDTSFFFFIACVY